MSNKSRFFADGRRKLYNYKRNADRRSIAFRLTDREAIRLFHGVCTFCGTPPDQRTGLHGIDRLDNNGPYILSNCTTC